MRGRANGGNVFFCRISVFGAREGRNTAAVWCDRVAQMLNERALKKISFRGTDAVQRAFCGGTDRIEKGQSDRLSA
jgi:hypothetical protein